MLPNIALQGLNLTLSRHPFVALEHRDKGFRVRMKLESSLLQTSECFLSQAGTRDHFRLTVRFYAFPFSAKHQEEIGKSLD